MIYARSDELPCSLACSQLKKEEEWKYLKNDATINYALYATIQKFHLNLCCICILMHAYTFIILLKISCNQGGYSLLEAISHFLRKYSPMFNLLKIRVLKLIQATYLLEH